MSIFFIFQLVKSGIVFKSIRWGHFHFKEKVEKQYYYSTVMKHHEMWIISNILKVEVIEDTTEALLVLC